MFVCKRELPDIFQRLFVFVKPDSTRLSHDEEIDNVLFADPCLVFVLFSFCNPGLRLTVIVTTSDHQLLSQIVRGELARMPRIVVKLMLRTLADRPCTYIMRGLLSTIVPEHLCISHLKRVRSSVI